MTMLCNQDLQGGRIVNFRCCTVIYQSSDTFCVCTRFFSICTKLVLAVHLNKYDAKTIANYANRIQNVFVKAAC